MKIDCKENYIGGGLVHKIYRYKDSVYKVPRDEFEDFNNFEHFAVERMSHEILRNNALPAVKVINIHEKGDLVTGKYVLEEPFVAGIIVDNPNVSDKQKRQIIALMLKANEIVVEGYGRINSKGVANFSSWREYIQKSTVESTPILHSAMKQLLRSYWDFLIENVNIVPELQQGYLLMLDTNSNNYIFNEHEEVISILDVDHPISGDKLYEYAALKFHHPEIFALLESDYIKFESQQKELLNYYFIHFGISTIVFEIKHNLDTTNTLLRLKNAGL